MARGGTNRRRTRRRTCIARRLLLESLEARLPLASDWQNPFASRDMSGDFVVSPLDGLLGINELNTPTIINSLGRLPNRALHPGAPFFDPSGDGFLSPLDILLIRNALEQDRTGPTIDVQLEMDTGPEGLNSDRVTSHSILVGQISDDLTGISSFIGQLDGGAFFDVGFSNFGEFVFDPGFATDGSDDGEHVLLLSAQDGRSFSSATALRFTLDTVAPQLTLDGPGEGATLRGGERLRGAVFDALSAPDVAYFLDGEPTQEVFPIFGQPGEVVNYEEQLDVFGLTSGSRMLHVSATDVAGNTTGAAVNVTVANDASFALTAHTPLDGATEVGSFFHPQVHFARPVDSATLTDENFFASIGDRKLPARIVASNEGRFAWLFFEEPLPSSSRVQITVDGTTILPLGGGAPLDADRDDIPGGTLRYEFTSVSLAPVPNTTVVGKIVEPGPDLLPMTADDFDPGPDGVPMTADDVFLLPIPDVHIYILGLEQHAVFTDAEGRFALDQVPAGNFKFVSNGMTAPAPDGLYFPEMVMDARANAGRQNLIMGMEVMYLPRLPLDILKFVDASQTTRIVADEVTAPQLPVEQRQLLTLEVPADSLVGLDGRKLDSALIGISTVPPELVEGMLPPGVLKHSFDITVQTPGIANFSTPAPMTFPNVFGAAPGSKLNFLSFDHTTGRLVIEGTATVSDDGLSARTDVGTGITHPGWHGLTPPGTDTMPKPPEPDPDPPCDPGNPPPPKEPLKAPPVSITGDSKFFTSGGTQGNIVVSNNGLPGVHETAFVSMTVNGLESFITSLSSQNFPLAPGQSKSFPITARSIDIGERQQIRKAGHAGEIHSGSVHIKVTAKIKEKEPPVDPCNMGPAPPPPPPPMIVTVGDKRLYFAQLFAADQQGLLFPPALKTVADPSKPPEPRVITVPLKGSDTPEYRFVGDRRLMLEKAGALLRVTLTDDPDDTTRPEGDINVTEPRQGGAAMGSAPVNQPDLIDLDPLLIKVVAGEIKGSFGETKGEESFSIKGGEIEIGLNTSPFKPLLTLKGSFEVTKDFITAQGSFTTDLSQVVGGQSGPITLHVGRFLIPRGKSDGGMVMGDKPADGNDPAAGKQTDSCGDELPMPPDPMGQQHVALAGLGFSLTGLNFAPGRLELMGSITLPKKLGGIKVSVENPNKVVIDEQGVHLDGFRVTLPDKSFCISGVKLSGSMMSLEYTGRKEAPPTPEAFRIRGVFKLETKRVGSPTPGVGQEDRSTFTLEANLAGDNYIEVTPLSDMPGGGLQIGAFEINIKGAFKIAELDLVKGRFKLKELSVTVDTKDQRFGGSARLFLPSGIEAAGELEFLVRDLDGNETNGKNLLLNKIFVKTTTLNRPIGSVFFLQTLGVGVDRLAEFDMPVEFIGAIGGSIGPQVRINLPDELGGTDTIATLLGLDVVASVSTQGIKLRPGTTLTVLIPTFFQGTATGELNWETSQHTLTVNLMGMGDAFKLTGTCSITGSLFVEESGKPEIVCRGRADVQVPTTFKKLPFAGAPLGSAQFFLKFNADGNNSNDFLKVWGQVTNHGPFGFFFGLDGQFGFMDKNTVPEVLPPAPGGEGGPAASQRFDVPANRRRLYLTAAWDNPSANVMVQVVRPNGTVLTEADILADPNMEIAADLTTDLRRVVVVNNPEAGVWTSRVMDATGLGEVVLSALAESPPPTIALLTPAADTQQTQVTVNYSAFDPNFQGGISFYLDSTLGGFDGTLVADGVIEQDGAGSVVIDTSTLELPSGEYFLYAVLDDEANAPAFSNYAPGRITVVDPDAPGVVGNVQASWLGSDEIELSWNPLNHADLYEISLTDNAAGGGFQQQFTVAGDETTVVIGPHVADPPLIPGETYRFQVRGVRMMEVTPGVTKEVLGLAGGQAVITVGVAPTIGPEAGQSVAGQFSVFADPGTTVTQQVSVLPGDVLVSKQLPAGATLNTTTGQFQWNVPPTATGFSEVEVQITNAAGEVRLEEFTLYSQANRLAGIRAQKFIDLDRDGLKDASEVGLNGVTIELRDAITGAVLRSAVTADQDLNGDSVIQPTTERGIALFASVTPGRYLLREVPNPTLGDFFSPTAQQAVVQAAAGALGQAALGRTEQGSISGVVHFDHNFDGGRDAGAVGFRVFLDQNRNGTYEEGEPQAISASDLANTTDVDESGRFVISHVRSGEHLLRWEVEEGFAQQMPAPGEGIVVNLATDQAVSNVAFTIVPQPNGLHPLAVVLEAATDAAFVDEAVDFGRILVDGPGGSEGVLALRLSNHGDQNLVVTAINIADATGSFALTGLPAGARLAPESLTAGDSSVPFQIRFNPTRTGAIEATLTITTNDPAGPLVLALNGAGRSPLADMQLDVPNNNAGGVVVNGPTVVRGFGTIHNAGAAPLHLTGILGDDFAIVGLPADLSPQNPLVIPPDGTAPFDLQVRAGAAGLQRGVISFLTNDPNAARADVRVVATGLAAADADGKIGNDYVAMETPEVVGAPVLRGRSDAKGNYSFFLAADSSYRVTLFDPETGLVAHFGNVTEQSGQTTIIPALGYFASTDPDTDGDGLPDDVEFAIGTSANNRDSDGNGIDDFTAIKDGLDPLGGQAFPTGIIASLPLPGQAMNLRLVGSIDDPEVLTAYVATGAHGLAIVDAARFDMPVLLGALDLPGANRDVAYDAKRDMALVAGGSAGLHLVDVSDPMAPALVETLQFPFNVNHVEIFNDFAYLGAGARLLSIDLTTRELFQTLSLGSTDISDLVREGNRFYTMEASNVLRVIDTSSFVMEQVGQIGVPFGGSRIFVGNDIVYVAADSRGAGGYSTVDVSNPHNPLLISGPDNDANIGFADYSIAVNGSGLGLLVGEAQLFPNRPAADLLVTADPQQTDRFVTRFTPPTKPHHVAIAKGIAFLADGVSGLQVINYQAFDVNGVAPTITLGALVTDLDPNAPGVQVTEGTSIPLRADVTDDVQVRNVALLVDGELVANDVSFPFDLATVALSEDPQAATVVVQARATDTGGNVSLSNRLELDLVPDTFAPSILSSFPDDGTEVGVGLRTVRVRFDESLDPATVTSANFRLLDEQNNPIAAELIALQFDNRVVSINYPVLPLGTFRLIVDAPHVTDRVGNALGAAEVVKTFKVIDVDAFWIGGNGSFTDPTNWNTGVVPGPNDRVLINAPGDIIVSMTSGNATVRTLRAVDRFAIVGGSLQVTDIAELLAGVTISGGSLAGLWRVEGNSTWSGGDVHGTVTNVGVLTLSGTGNKDLGPQGVLVNQGTIRITDSGPLRLFADNVSRASTITNEATGLLDFQSDADIDWVSGSFPTPSFTNRGTVRKSGGSGESFLESSIVNVDANAIFDVRTGTLAWQSAGTSTGGTFHVAANATLDLVRSTGESPLLSGTYTGTGAGTVLLTRGTLRPGTDAVFNFPAGLFQWRGGTINSGTLTNTGVLTLSGTGDKDLGTQGLLVNQGTISITDSGPLRLFADNVSRASTITNEAGALLDFQSDADIDWVFGSFPTPSFTNRGTVRKSGGSGESFLESSIVNVDANAIFDVRSGTLAWQSAGTSTGGTFHVAAGATFDLVGSASYSPVLSGSYAGTGDGTVLLTRGTLRPGTNAVFNFPAGLFQWRGGAIDSGTLTNAGVLTLSGTGNKDLGTQGVLVNQGTIALTESGPLRLFADNVSRASTITNEAGALLDFQSDADIDWVFGSFPTPSFTNRGIVRKSAGTDVSFLEADLINAGLTAVFEVQASTLAWHTSGTSTGGTFHVAAGATFDLVGSASYSPVLSGTYTGTGDGTVLLTRGTLRPGANAVFNFPAGLFQWRGGDINAGTLTNTDVMTLSGTANKDLGASGVLINQGTIAITESGPLRLFADNVSRSSTITNEAGAVIDFQGDADIDWVSGSSPAPVVTNHGTLRKSAGGDKSFLESDFRNQTTGMIEVQSGELELQRGGNSTGKSLGGTFNVSAAATLDLTGGRHNIFEGSYTGSGAGTVVVDSGLLQPGPAGATFNFPAGLFHWQGGLIDGGTLTNTGVITLSGTGNKDLGATGVLLNQGTINVADTGIWRLFADNGSAASSITNEAGAVIDFQGDADLDWVSGSSPAPTVTNHGTVRKSGGAAVSFLEGNVVNARQEAVLEVQSGTLALHSLGTSTGGTFHVSSNAALDLVGDANLSPTFSGAYTGSGTGTVLLTRGTLRPGANAVFNFPAGLFQWRGGAIDGGTLTNAGVLTLSGTGNKDLGTQGVLVNQGTIAITESGPLRLFADNGSRASTITNDAGAVIEFQGDADIAWVSGSSPAPNLTNRGTFRKSAGNGLSSVGGDLTNPQGSIDVRTGTLRVFAPLSSGGNVAVAAGSTLDLTGQSYTQTGGQTRLTGGALIAASVNIQAGELSGNGAVTANVTSGGRLLAGVSPGLLQINGSLTLTGSSETIVELAGTDASQFDRMTVSGTATLGGTLRIELLDGFVPTAGNSFTVLTFNSRANDFATIEGSDLGSGLTLQPQFDATSLSLVAMQALRLAEGGPADPPALESLLPAQVVSAFEAALDRWAATGLAEDRLASLTAIEIGILDLPGNLLAVAGGGRILVDIDAAGQGWFVDATPHDDEEFSGLPATGLTAIEPDALEGVDLLTVMAHELGHLLGLDHVELETDLLAETLARGQRRLPTPAVVDRLFARDAWR